MSDMSQGLTSWLNRVMEARDRGVVFVQRRERLLLWLGAGVFVILFTSLAAWKLWSFGYNGIDLAYYRQVFEHSVRGDWFGFTIHPYKSLGDHLALFLAVLWPVYAIWKHPVVLPLVQAIALASAVWPVVRIGARVVGRPWHLVFVLAYLANPIVQNSAAFEFHELPFAIPILFWAILAYMNKRFGRYLALLVLAMTVREDVPLAIVGLGLLAIADRRRWQWWAVPIGLGLAWFFAATKLTSHFNGYDHYKFIVYYQWLGKSWSAILRNALTHPWLVVMHVARWSTVGLFFVTLMPVAFLPLRRGRWLIPLVLVVPELLLGSSLSLAAIQSHYLALYVPFLLMASMVAWASLVNRPIRLTSQLEVPSAAIKLLVVGIIVYGSLGLGPLPSAVSALAQSGKIADRVHLERAMVRALPAGTTAASLETLTDVADRTKLVSLHYIFLGHQQFSDRPYTLPTDTTAVLMDQRDFLFYQLLYPIETPAGRTGYQRLRNLLTERGLHLTAATDRFMVFTKGTIPLNVQPLYSMGAASHLNGTQSTHDDIQFLGWSSDSGLLSTVTSSFGGHSFRLMPVSFTFEKTTAQPTLYQLEFSFRTNGKVVYRQVMPFGGGLFPTSDWSAGQPVTTNLRLLLPGWLRGQTDVEVRVLNLNGGLGLNGVRTTVPIYTTYRAVGPVIDLGKLTL